MDSTLAKRPLLSRKNWAPDFSEHPNKLRHMDTKRLRLVLEKLESLDSVEQGGSSSSAIAWKDPRPWRRRRRSLRRLTMSSKPLPYNPIAKVRVEFHQLEGHVYGRVSASDTTSNSRRLLREDASVFRRKICGDIFGTNMLGTSIAIAGLVYRGRVQARSNGGGYTGSLPRRRNIEDDENILASTIDVSDADPDNLFGEREGDEIEKWESSRRVAFTLKDWCQKSANVDALLAGGVVDVLVKLCKEPQSDAQTKSMALLALNGLARETRICGDLLERGVVGAVAVMVTQATEKLDKTILASCAVVLLNLSIVQGGERVIVAQQGLSAISTLMRAPGLQAIGVQTLFNLTAVKKSYVGLDRVVKTLLTLALPPCAGSAQKIMACGLVNASKFYHLRQRMLRDGVLLFFQSMLKDGLFKDSTVAYIVAVALHNISCARGARNDLLNSRRGVLVLMRGLLDASEDVRIMEIVMGIAERITTVTLGRVGLVRDGLVEIVAQALKRSETISQHEIQSAAGCLSNLARQQECPCALLVQHDIVRLLKLLCCRGVGDAVTAQHCADCMVSLLSDTDPFVTESVGKENAVVVVLRMLAGVRDARIMSSLSALLKKLAYSDDNIMRAAIEGGIIPAIVALANTSKKDVQLSCAAALCGVVANVSHLSDDEIRHVFSCIAKLQQHKVPQLDALLTTAVGILSPRIHLTDEETCEAMCVNICDFAGGQQIDHLLVACATLLAHLSKDERGAEILWRMNVFGITRRILSVDDEDNRRINHVFSIMLCNLTAIRSRHDYLLKEGVLDVLKALSNSHSERCQENCARAVLNLTAEQHNREMIVSNGGIDLLLTIMFVRAARLETKRLAANALTSLVDETSIEVAVNERVYLSLKELSAFPSETLLCAAISLFRKLVLFSGGRLQIARHASCMRACVQMMRVDDVDSKRQCATALYALLKDDTTRHASVKNGGLRALKLMSVAADQVLERLCARCMVLVIGDDACREDLQKDDSFIAILVYLSAKSDEDTRVWAVSAITVASFYNNLRNVVMERGGAAALVSTLLSKLVVTEKPKRASAHSQTTTTWRDRELQEQIARSLCYISISRTHREALTQQYCVPALHAICANLAGRGREDAESAVGRTKRVLGLCAFTVENLSRAKSTFKLLLEHRAIELLYDILERVEVGESSMDVDIVQHVMVAVANLSRDEMFHSSLERLPLISKFLALSRSRVFASRTEVARLVFATCYNLSTRDNAHEQLVRDGVVTLLHDLVCEEQTLCNSAYDANAQFCAATLRKLSRTRTCLPALVRDGAQEILMNISEGSNNAITLDHCSVALARISSHSNVREGDVHRLIRIGLQVEGHALGEQTDSQTDVQRRYKLLRSIALSSVFQLADLGKVAGKQGFLATAPSLKHFLATPEEHREYFAHVRSLCLESADDGESSSSASSIVFELHTADHYPPLIQPPTIPTDAPIAKCTAQTFALPDESELIIDIPKLIETPDFKTAVKLNSTNELGVDKTTTV